jgi:branched-chain amino acid transport system permease protein
MYPPSIIAEAVANGLLTGGIYSLVALGLTLIYGVLHIINFAHGALLTCAMFAVWGLGAAFGLNPYVAILPLVPVFFVLGYALQRFVIGPASRGRDSNVLLVTLGLAIAIQNGLLAVFHADTRSLDSGDAFDVVAVGPMLLSQPKLIGFAVSVAVAVLLWWLLARTDTGRAIRAVARDDLGARLVGIDVRHVFGVTFGIGCACLAVAAGLLMPGYTVNPRAGEAFVLITFTIVVLGGMGSVLGAVVGGLLIGVVESLSGLFLGDSLGQIGIFGIFILVLLMRPAGLFGARA